jgi:hypothetical protein
MTDLMIVPEPEKPESDFLPLAPSEMPTIVPGAQCIRMHVKDLLHSIDRKVLRIQSKLFALGWLRY